MPKCISFVMWTVAFPGTPFTTGNPIREDPGMKIGEVCSYFRILTYEQEEACIKW